MPTESDQLEARVRRLEDDRWSTESSGHGLVVDLAQIDEAWAQKDARLEQGFRPAMATRENAQLWVASTMGGFRVDVLA